MSRRRVLGVGLLALVLVLAAGVVVGVQLWQRASRTDLESALAAAPEDATRLSWTDWRDVRREVGLKLTTASDRSDINDLIDAGYDEDLIANSALVESAETLQLEYGFSPATAEWELFSQSEQGAVIIVKLPDSIDFDTIAANLAKLDYDKPKTDNGLWSASPDTLGRIGDITPELTFIALNRDEHLLMTSDTSVYLKKAVAGADEGEGPKALRAAAEPLDSPLSAGIYTGDYACGALAMNQADPRDQQEADQLIAEAGKVNPYRAFALASYADLKARVVMTFENADQARTNADSRSILASGPAPGQGGEFSERFKLGKVVADGEVLTMALTAVEGSYLVSDLTNGPVLFATC